MDDIPSWYFKFDDGKYHLLRSLTDQRWLLQQGIVVPRYAGSMYYSLERNGTIYHVFNAERMVGASHEGLRKSLQPGSQVLDRKAQANLQER